MLMGFRRFFPRKKEKAEPCCRRLRSFFRMFPRIFHSVPPESKCPPSQSLGKSPRPPGAKSARRNARKDEPVEVYRPPPPDTQSNSIVGAEKVFKKFDTDSDLKLSSSAPGGKPTEEKVRVNVSDDVTVTAAHNNKSVDGSRRVQELRDAFRMFDKDGDGFISPSELLRVFIILLEPCTLEDCEATIRKFDSNGDGLIGFDEFMAMMNTPDGSADRIST